MTEPFESQDLPEEAISRRDFLQGARGWSAVVAGLALGITVRPESASGWLDHYTWHNGAGWVNRRGWINGGSWSNRAGWTNGGVWTNHTGWTNRGWGGGWINHR